MSPALRGGASWYFVQMIGEGVITVGTTVSILRQHPFHQDSLTSVHGTSGTRASSSTGILLRGKVRALSGVKESDAFYIVDDELSGQLAMIRLPTRHTDLKREGRWVWLAKPVGRRRGMIIWHPAYISERDICGPGTVAARQAREAAFICESAICDPGTVAARQDRIESAIK